MVAYTGSATGMILKMLRSLIPLVIFLCLGVWLNQALAAEDTPFSRICDPQNGCIEWTIKSLRFDGEEGRICKTIADNRCHPCWREHGKKLCAPILGSATIHGVNVRAAEGKSSDIGTNSFNFTCTGDVSPEVTPLPSNVSYPLDKRMFEASFVPREKAVYYNLWWAACRNQNRKFDLEAPATSSSQRVVAAENRDAVPANPSLPEKASSGTKPPLSPGAKTNDKERKNYVFLYQQYMVLKMCEEKSNGEIRLDALRNRMKILDQNAREHGYDPDTLYEEAKSASINEMHKIVLSAISMLPMMGSSDKMQIVSMCRSLAEKQGQIIEATIGAQRSNGSSSETLKKDF